MSSWNYTAVVALLWCKLILTNLLVLGFLVCVCVCAMFFFFQANLLLYLEEGLFPSPLSQHTKFLQRGPQVHWSRFDNWGHTTVSVALFRSVIVVLEGLDVVVCSSSTADPELAGLIHEGRDSLWSKSCENVIARFHDDL